MTSLYFSFNKKLAPVKSTIRSSRHWLATSFDNIKCVDADLIPPSRDHKTVAFSNLANILLGTCLTTAKHRETSELQTSMNSSKNQTIVQKLAYKRVCKCEEQITRIVFKVIEEILAGSYQNTLA